VFDRFFRAGTGRARGVVWRGSGLGLSIVSALVADLGGSVGLVATTRGTAVAVTLPREPAGDGSVGQRAVTAAGDSGD
jgi:signal transduction histidine kinase